MGRLTAKEIHPKFLLLIFVVSLSVGAGGHFFSPKAYAADLMPRSITMSDSAATAPGVSYDLSFTYATGGNVGSVLIQFCQEGPLPFTLCTQPAGFDASSVSLVNQTGEDGFTVFVGSTANEIILTRPSSGVVGGTPSNYTFEGVTNPSDEGTLYARVLTFASSDASGPATDTGGFALAINESPTITAEVPPFLTFCIGESIPGLDCGLATDPFSDMGTLGPLVTGAAQTQMLAATNGAGGYSMWVTGGTMTSGNNTIPAMSGDPSQQGVGQFGINLRANSDPIIGQEVSGPGSASVDPAYAVQNQYRYQPGGTLASVNAPDDYRKYTVSYIVNVADGQPGGVYSTTLTYICLANF
jgi:hypothetical protein